ncbi:hypothetical protein Pfo_030866 [Paulownia fortunei]|nr:hypothetical protein Pfo_030866 [Paulownia fortunei]
MERKRGQQWFSDNAKLELFPCKKQGVEVPINKPESGIIMSNAMDYPKIGVNYGGIRKVKVDQVKDLENRLHTSMEHDLGMSMNQTYTRGSENTFISMEQPYGKEFGNATSLGHSYDIRDANIRSVGSTFDNAEITTQSRNKGGSNAISFGSYQDVMDALARPVSSYSLLYELSSVQTSKTPRKKEVNVTNGNAIVSRFQKPKSRLESTYKNKSEKKAISKEASNRFPTNVKSLTVTGMLDGVPVRYVSVSREELSGIIKGSGYLCGCRSCNYSKALNAYEFEHHAGCKTNHPNNHIHFENGKTIYQIVQELKITPESMLVDAIQTVTGSPINQKVFHVWKESFQATTGKFQRISTKKQLHL